MNTYNLEATSQNSYYGKAKVIESENKSSLKSYETIVCEMENGNFHKLWNGYSATTMKHINDFRRLFGLPKLSKKEWDNLPCDNSEKYKVEFSNGFVSWKAGTIFDDYNAADEYAESVCEKNNWRYSYTVCEL